MCSSMSIEDEMDRACLRVELKSIDEGEMAKIWDVPGPGILRRMLRVRDVGERPHLPEHVALRLAVGELGQSLPIGI